MTKARELAELSRTVSDSADAVAITINSSEQVSFSSDVLLADNGKAIFGAGSDLQIYHDGSNNYVDAAGLGHLYLQSQGDDKDVKIQSDDGSGGLTEYFRADGSLGQAQLYYYGSKKLHTVTGGIDVTGTVTADGGDFSGQVQFNGTAGVQLDDGAQAHTWTLDDNFTSRLNIGTSSASAAWKIGSNNNAYLTVSPSGVDVTGTATAASFETDAGGTFTTASGNDLNIVYPTSRSLFIKEGSDTHVTVDNAGNVGIGTTSPGTFRTKIKHSAASVTTGLGIEASANDSVLRVFHSGSLAGFNATYSSTGAYVPMVFNVGSGGEAVRIDTDGNVGIGTDSPNTLTHIYGGSSGRTWTPDNADKLALEHSSSVAFDIRTPASEQGLIMFSDADARARGILAYAHSSDFTYFNTAGAEAMRIGSSGNVGIGTQSPDTKLHLSDAGAPELRLESTDSSVITGQSLGDITWESNDVSTGGQGVRAKIHAEAENAGTIYGLVFSTGSGAAPTEKARITNIGDLLVGCNDSTFEDVNRVNLEIAGPSDSLFALSDEHGGTLNNRFYIHNNRTNSLITYLSDSTFDQRWYAGGSEKMRLTSSGNVGINTANPQTALDVYGAIGISNSTTSYWSIDRNNTTGALEINDTGSADQFVLSVGGKLTVGVGGNAAGDVLELANGGYSTKVTHDSDKSLIHGNSASRDLAFGANNAEAFRVNTSGNLLLGQTSHVGPGNGNTTTGGGWEGSGRFWASTASADHGFNRNSTGVNISIRNSGTQIGYIFNNASSVTYNTTSDQRLKENIVDAPSASDDIDAIQVRSFDWKADGSHQKYGMVAQELVTVAPNAVAQPEDPEEMMGVDYSVLVPMMLKEIQQLRARVAQLEGAD
jgi:hypothetical protein